MAKLLPDNEFINQNVDLLRERLSSQYTRFLDSKPTFCTYYHINTKMSSVDKGTYDIENLINESSPIRYNKIENFPIYGIEQIQLDLDDGEFGYNIEYDGEGIVLPNTIYPLTDDYFKIQYLGEKYLFRVISINYDTIKSNSFYKIGFTLKSTNESDSHKIDNLVVDNYHCLFENIGTSDKCIIRDDNYFLLTKINNIIENLQDEYLNKYRDPRYNALMFLRASNMYLYDAMLNKFCNSTKVFDKGPKNTDTCLLYQEERTYFGMDFEDSIYDRIINRDTSDLNEINTYYDMEPALSTDSIFDFYRDDRVKYMAYYPEEIGPFSNKLSPYISRDFLLAIDCKNPHLLKNSYENFVCRYMIHDIEQLVPFIDDISKRRIKYSFTNFIFIPIVLYVLKQLVNHIVVNNTIMDEKVIHNNI